MTKDTKIYSYSNLDDKTLEILSNTCIEYANMYNYFTERYCGIRNIYNTSSIINTRKNIRDKLVDDLYFKSTFRIQSKLWKNALEEATSNIRSMWSNLYNKIRKKIYKNENLNDNQKYFINYLFKSPKLLENILVSHNLTIPDKFTGLLTKSEFRKTCNLLKRYIRRYKPTKPKNSKNRSYMLESVMYSYTEREGILYIRVTTCIKGKRVEIPLKSNKKLTGNIRLVLDKDKKRIILHKCIDSKESDLEVSDKEIGIDKGINKLISTSTGNTYGLEIGKILEDKTQWETETLKNKQVHRKAYYKAIKKGNLEKAKRIKESNLGNKRFNRKETKYKKHLESRINYNLRKFFTLEKPSTLILEDLSFTTWTKPMESKLKYKLSSWYKGYLDERLEYLAKYYHAKIIYINPAYTSQTCSKCGHIDKNSRKGEQFRCTHCGFEMDADINASKNILERGKDSRITLYTPYKKVKEIIEAKN